MKTFVRTLNLMLARFKAVRYEKVRAKRLYLEISVLIQPRASVGKGRKKVPSKVHDGRYQLNVLH